VPAGSGVIVLLVVTWAMPSIDLRVDRVHVNSRDRK
jgi:hypothetical protein